MLVPQSVLLADPGGRAFRRSNLRPDPQDQIDPEGRTGLQYQTLAVDDFVAINPFSPDASNQTVALYLRPGQPARFPAPMRSWRRARRVRLGHDSGWHRVEPLLTVESRQIAPVEDGEIESPWGLVPVERSLSLAAPGRENCYSFGRGFETRGLDGFFTYRIVTPAGGHPAQIRVRNEPEAGRNTADETPREGVVEPELFWPLAKGEDISRWRVSLPGRYIFVPYDVTQDPTAPVTTVDCATEYPRLFRYLQRWLARFAARSMYQATLTEGFPWALSGPIEHLSASGALVFVRYLATSGRPAAAVATAAYDERLNRTTLPLPNNKSNIYYTRSTEEAHFLAGFINSSPAQGALSRFAVSTGVTPVALERLPIPRFDQADRNHVRVAQLAQEASRIANDPTGDAEELAAVEKELDQCVWETAQSV
jgi:hypothetical protein